MAIIQTINIGGQDVPFKASAAIPRVYRLKYRRDIFADLDALVKRVGESSAEASTLDGFSLEIFENIAHTMAKYADPGVPDSIEAWLDGFDMFSIYEILPQIIELWNLNMETEQTAKKNLTRLTGS